MSDSIQHLEFWGEHLEKVIKNLEEIFQRIGESSVRKFFIEKVFKQKRFNGGKLHSHECQVWKQQLNEKQKD